MYSWYTNAMSTTLKLYKCRPNGSIGLIEVSRGSFSDADSYQQALDFHYEQGYCDSQEEARDAHLAAQTAQNAPDPYANGDSFGP